VCWLCEGEWGVYLALGCWAWLFPIVGLSGPRECEHFLQAGDQDVGFAGALGPLFDLAVLDADLAPEKFVFVFDALDISRQVWTGRGMSVPVAGPGVCSAASK
jgi:hypothetical protein